MVQLRSVGVLSVGKMMGIVQGAIGLLFLPFFLIVALASTAAGKQEAVLAGGVMVVFAVMMPVFYAGIGFVMGIVMAAIYNFVSGKIGGIELELGPAPPMAAPVNPAVPQ